MKTQYYTASSLDGFIADPEHSLAWLLQFGDGSGEDYAAFINQVGAIAMGSTTYQWVLRHLATADDDKAPQAWPYQLPCWVFTSRSLPTAKGAEIRFVAGDVRPVHQQMRKAAANKNIWIVGGGELAGQFYDHGLLDELIVQIAPVTLGAGSPLLPRAITMPPLRLVSATVSDQTFARLHYEVPLQMRAPGG